MTKITNAIRGTPAQRFDAEQRAIADVEREIVDLEQQRAAKLVDDEPTGALQLADKIASARRRLATHQDRLTAFQGEARRERVKNRQREKDEALAGFEKQFAERAAGAGRITAAIAELGSALKAYREQCRLPFQNWPDVFPDLRLFQDSAYSNVESRIGAALYMRSPGVAHTLLTDLGKRLGNLAERDILLGASLVESIKNAPLPKHRENEEVA